MRTIRTLDRGAVLAAALFLTFVFSLLSSANEMPRSASAPFAAELTRHVQTLAADDMMGRGVDTPGIDLARDYIAAQFKKYGLAPGGTEGYFQRLEVTSGVETAGRNEARLGTAELALGRDWNPLGLSASAAAEGDVVFAGYGITAENYAYDDYAGIDAKGKIVLVLRYEPPPQDDKSPFGRWPRSSRYATLSAKAANARAHGAAGLILVDLSSDHDELMSLARGMGREQDDLAAAQIRRETVQTALRGAGVSLSDLKAAIDRDQKPHPTAIAGLKARLAVSLKKISRPTDNVVAVLPGSDPQLKSENIVIGAHYDHLGLGHYGTMDPKAEGQIHNGADDNASGVAVVLSLAQRFAAGKPPPRTLVFVAFTGEELGLYGSRHFVDHPPFPLTATKAMINLDMVGRMRENRLMVNTADTAKEFRAMIGRAADGLAVDMKATGGGSDHASFYNKGIPALHFYTGMHEDYHRPTDDWEKLNIGGMVKVSDTVFALATDLAGSREPLAFVKPPSRRGG
ncbi:MAG TPA: M20/M25/M40 family metallo-hydrolase [Candidatus Binatia bacterium]|jgi:acetylornithine deacetylase/succinyl-diaminopimelate desuccinylase-like protein